MIPSSKDCTWTAASKIPSLIARPRAKQHQSIALYMGGLTPCPEVVDEILDPEKHTDPNSPATILDLGCGSGIWAIEMVRMFTTVLILCSNGLVVLGSKVPTRVGRGFGPRSSRFRHIENSW
jgi:hypothetical protein